MTTLSVLGSSQKFIERFRKTLARKKFRNIRVDYLSCEITADRKNIFFLKEYSLLLTFKQVRDMVTNIDLTVNPHRRSNHSDESKERELEKKFISIL
jgi:hypothetical protein